MTNLAIDSIDFLAIDGQSYLAVDLLDNNPRNYASQVLPTLDQSLSGLVITVGSVTQTLPALSQTGSVGFTGDHIKIYLAPLFQSLVGNVFTVGNISQTLPQITQNLILPRIRLRVSSQLTYVQSISLTRLKQIAWSDDLDYIGQFHNAIVIGIHQALALSDNLNNQREVISQSLGLADSFDFDVTSGLNHSLDFQSSFEASLNGGKDLTSTLEFRSTLTAYINYCGD